MGDGGPASQAEIDNSGGLVFTSDGTLYFTQAGRYRAPISSNFGGISNTVIREIAPAGTIRTVAGLHPRCSPGPVGSIRAQAALFYGASLSLTSTGELAVGATLCVGKTSGKGFGPNLLLTRSGRFITDSSSPVPAVASISCGSGVRGRGFRVFSCGSGGGNGPDGHGQELLVVRSDGSSVAYSEHRGGGFAVGHGEVVASYNQMVVRVTGDRLVPLVTNRQLQKALGLQASTRPLTDVAVLTIGGSGLSRLVTVTGKASLPRPREDAESSV